jgi:hypothetical protein
MGDIVHRHIKGAKAAGKGKRAVSATNNNNTWNGHSLIPALFHTLIAKIDK